MSDAPRIYVVDDEHCIAAWRNVYFSIWRKNPSAARLQNLRTLAQRFMKETSGPVFALVLVEEKCPVPDDAGRDHSIRFIRDLSDRALGIVLVFEGQGFMAAASRAVMVGLMSAAKFAIPYKILQDAPAAERFFESRDKDHAPPRGTLVKAIEDARAKIGKPNVLAG